MIKDLSRAKINLMLEVISKRSDGFHEIKSIMQTISLCDEINIQASERAGIQLSVEPANFCAVQQNLVYIAAEVFFRTLKINPAIKINLLKRIPVGAGLGGGSSNAALTLKLLNRMYETPFTTDQLLDMAALLGSDVCFFINGGTSLAFGRGEKIMTLPDLGCYHILLLNPGFSVETKQVYRHHKLDLTSCNRISNILPVFMAGQMSDRDLIKHVHNDLQATVLMLFPELRELLDWIADQKPDAFNVSGSGATVWGLFSDKKSANKAAVKANELFPWVFLAETVGRYE